MRDNKLFPLCLALLLTLTGCAGTRTFHEYARAGDTVAVAAGWKQSFTKDAITVTVTPAAGAPQVYAPGNPAIRAVVNLYPDPISSLVVSEKTKQNLTPSASTYGYMVNYNFTANDRDWFETTVFIDLPATLTTGQATITIVSNQGETASSTLEIIPGTGQPNTFSAELNGPLDDNQMAAMARVAHYTISFSGTSVPYAMQLAFTHAPDKSHGGTGVTHVANPRGDLKSLAWSDDGTNLKVILTPAQLTGIASLKDCKFYVAGGITNLSLGSLQAVDKDGNPITTVSAVVN